MKRVLARLATLAVALPLAAGLSAGTAQAATTASVPGCYGIGSSVYCDLTVTVGVPVGVFTYQTTVPVCAGSCYDVPVTLVGTGPGEPLSVCYQYRRLDGSSVSECSVGTGTVDQVVRFVEEQGGPLVDEIRYYIKTLPGEVVAYVRELLRSDACSVVVGVVNGTGIFSDMQCTN